MPYMIDIPNREIVLTDAAADQLMRLLRANPHRFVVASTQESQAILNLQAIRVIGSIEEIPEEHARCYVVSVEPL